MYISGRFDLKEALDSCSSNWFRLICTIHKLSRLLNTFLEDIKPLWNLPHPYVCFYLYRRQPIVFVYCLLFTKTMNCFHYCSIKLLQGTVACALYASPLLLEKFTSKYSRIKCTARNRLPVFPVHTYSRQCYLFSQNWIMQPVLAIAV